MAKVDYTYQSNAHIQRVAKYQQMLERFFDDATSEFCKLFGKAKYDDSSQFFFEDYPTLKKKADSVVNSLSSSIYDVILTGTSAEWKKSNEITDQMVRDLFKSRGVDIDKIKNSDVVDLFNNHDKALDAFQKRKIKGLSLSDKVWNMAEYHRLETQLALSIESGESAAELARKVKKCLNEPDKLFRRVRDKYGELKLSKNAKAYHPGAGAYRSSVRNAQRLARTEINMAYREAEMQRYQDLDFIVGFEVKRSTHPYPCDICESHKGKYPKDFKFNGWHPNCRCYVIPILNTQEEFDKQSDAILKGSKYGSASSKEVVDLPAGFKKWYGDNIGRIDRATQIGTLPYYMRDNKSYLNAVRQQVTAKADGGLMQDLAEKVAKSIGANCTPINYKSLPSMMRKCKADGCLASDLKDTVRTTIVTSSQEDIEKAISALEADSGELKLLRVKRQSTDVGYTGVICNFELPNGVVSEIQINTAEMIYAKEAPSIARAVIGEDVWDEIFKRTGLEGGLGHKYYEEFRLLDATSDKALEIANKSREYYSHFNSKAKGIANVDTSKLPPKLRQAFEEMTSDEMYSLMYGGRINSFSDYCKTAGLSDEELEILFNAVVDKTDVYMSISSSTLEKKIILGDGKFKSSIETGKGTFGTIGEERAIKERKMFGMADDCGVDDYPKYGFLSKQGQMSYENIVDWGYGDVYVCFDKRKIGNRSTFTIGDSYAHNSYYDRSYLERKARDLKDRLKYNDWDTANVPKWKKELSEIEELLSKDTAWKEVAPASSLSAPNAKSLIGVNPERVKDILYEGIDKLAASSGQYAECQIYGALSMDDVLRIEVSSKKTKKALEKALKKQGLDIDVVPAKFDQRVKYLKEGITTYDGKASQYAHSLLPRDVDNLGESFVDGLSQRFADDTLGYLKNSKSNPFADIDGFVSFAEQIKSGKATIKEKREFLKIFYEEMHKGKAKGRLPKVWYEDFRSSLGGWTDDLIDMDLLK